nr:uncharacterized protein LOC118030695 [Populus alba]
MLRIQSSSVKFPIAKVMGEIAEGEFEANIESSVKISMAILGKNKILPLLGKSKGSSGHRLLKYIALYLPRNDRCTCKECEVLSGIFGNAFWHENVSPALHQWLNTESATKLPMSAFPHLRRICNSGYIVDSNGNNSFLIHPERMAISTLYISGDFLSC